MLGGTLRVVTLASLEAAIVDGWSAIQKLLFGGAWPPSGYRQW
jgi:hypothetical protein